MGAFVLSAGVARGSVLLSTPKLLAHVPRHRGKQKPSHVNPVLIRRYRDKAWRWQALTGTARTTHPLGPNTKASLRFWARTAGQAYLRAIHPPHRRAWLCIHRYEGSWRDSGDPYWGGLQMDRGFMAGYAPRYLLRRGLADRWSPFEQMWVAERAYRSGRGFHAWPSTARMCGLI
ncbi:MAG: hypothetical protein E6G21_00570 [Actinobacteria bacterium]|nr:MAG: hypothetical protein E6G21_00570 [Actinomycetota bacterium]